MRSKTLLVSNILATIYSVILLCVFGGAIISAGGIEYISYWQQYFNLIFELAGVGSATASLIYAIVILLITHISVFTFGTVFGWIGYFTKKSGLAKFGATLYLIGTICFPIYFFFGLPITIIAFVGGGKQKKLNNPIVQA